MPRLRPLLMVNVLLIFGGSALVAGQQAAGRGAAESDDGRARAQQALVESMSGPHMHHNPHLRLTVKRPERPGDRQRAAAIVASLKPALEKFRDYRVALASGYEIFMPQIAQPVYHFTSDLQGFAATFRFQADQATSLLYRKTAKGYDLVGAMYTAPADATELDLDARVPLSVAQWHQHVNICLPRRGQAAAADWKTFGPDGSIATKDACAAAGGRFFDRLFGWMVHVYPFETSFDKIWGMEESTFSH